MPASSPGVAKKATLCVLEFSSLIDILQKSPPEQRLGLTALTCEDELTRFKVWAGNIGALQEGHVTSSLEYRLRDIRRISDQIGSILNQILEDLGDVRNILVQNRPNQETVVSYGIDQVDDEDAHTITAYRSEILEIFGSVTDGIEELFKLSMLIRSATPRDRYSRAIANPRNPFEDSYDVAHVGQRYPKLAQKQNSWLMATLGKAITQRREFLRYARNHRHKLAADGISSIEISPQTLKDVHIPSPTLAESHAPTLQPSIPITTSFVQTKASTLLPYELDKGNTSDDGNTSTSSFVHSTIYEVDNVRIASLMNVAKNRPSFECPYCWHIVKCKNQRSWRKHVLKDLRPYVCTFQECSLMLFSDRKSWFEHELTTHRCKWKCEFCPSHSIFSSKENLSTHLRHRHHGQINETQFPANLDLFRQSADRISPSECPFCDDWALSLEKENVDVDGRDQVVTPTEFRDHVGRHMEHLAIFAIPVDNYENDDGMSSDSNAARNAWATPTENHNGESPSTLETGTILGDLESENDEFTNRKRLLESLKFAARESLSSELSDLFRDVESQPPMFWGDCVKRVLDNAGSDQVVEMTLSHVTDRLSIIHPSECLNLLNNLDLEELGLSVLHKVSEAFYSILGNVDTDIGPHVDSHSRLRYEPTVLFPTPSPYSEPFPPFNQLPLNRPGGGTWICPRCKKVNSNLTPDFCPFPDCQWNRGQDP